MSPQNIHSEPLLCLHLASNIAIFGMLFTKNHFGVLVKPHILAYFETFGASNAIHALFMNVFPTKVHSKISFINDLIANATIFITVSVTVCAIDFGTVI